MVRFAGNSATLNESKEGQHKVNYHAENQSLKVEVYDEGNEKPWKEYLTMKSFQLVMKNIKFVIFSERKIKREVIFERLLMLPTFEKGLTLNI